MMVKLSSYCILKGDYYSPLAAENELGVVFRSRNERGEIGKIGRYKDTSYPYGSSIFEDEHGLENVITFLEQHRTTLRSLGVTEFDFHVTVEFDEQCNFEIDKNIVKRISDLNLSIEFSCYKA